MHPDQTHFPVLPGPTSHLQTSAGNEKEKNKEEKKKYIKPKLCCPYIRWSMVELTVV